MKRIQSKILKNYSTPCEKIALFNENLKKQSAENKPLREIILNQVLYENPMASQARIEAIAFKKMNEACLKKVFFILDT